jgi:N-acetylmuramoyl-L-alanine amidase
MRKVVLFVLGMLFVFNAATLAAGESQVRSLRFWNEAGHIRVVFDLSTRVGRKVFLLDDPGRVVVDLENTRLATRVKQPDSSNPVFKRIRYAPRNQHDLRIVLDLKKKVRPESFFLKPNRKYGHRLVLDLFESGTPAPLAEKSIKNNVKTASKETSNSVSVVSAQRSKTAAGPKPRITQASRPSDMFVVAIDAGHGGNDPGARGALGTREKDVVLSIAKKLHRLIAQERGMRPVLIRDGDFFIPLRNRIRLARDANADIFVSIHADAFHQSNIGGSSVYTLSEKGASSEAARWLAAKENQSDLIGGVSLEDKEDTLVEVLLDLSQTAALDASADLANRVLQNLGQLGKTHKSSVQSAGFVVLKSPDIPSILVETAFISNPVEEKKLRNSAYQEKLAKAILGGIRDYYRLRAAPAMHMAARKHVIEPGETLSEIALRYGVSMRKLQAFNTLSTTEIKAGQVLQIPAGS